MSDENTTPKKKFVPLTITDAQIADLDEEHEDILVLRGPEKAPWVCVVRRPTRKETVAFKNHAKRDSATANEQLIRAICVFPSGKSEDFERQLNRWPFFVDGLTDTKSFKDFVGITVEEDVK